MQLRLTRHVLSVVVAALLAALSSFAGETPPKILYITTTAGFHHSACEYSVPVMEKLAKETGLFQVTCSAKTDLITAESLKGFDAVCFSNTTGDLNQFPLTEVNRNALIEAVKGGMAFIGIHAATDTYKDWQPYADMINGSFTAHPWSEEVTIDVEDPWHPAAVMLPAKWTVNDEIYTYKNYGRDKCHVIMSLAKESEKGRGNRPDGDYALAWAKMCGKGRVFYTALGHRHEVWDDALFQRHLIGGIGWALGKKQANMTLGHTKVASAWEKIFDGTSLAFGTDWESSDNPQASRKHWTLAPGGILRGFAGPGMPGSSHLYYTKKAYRNFEARARICISKDGNSGWYFRCAKDKNWNGKEWRDWPEGYEFQINNHSGDPRRTATFYPEPSLRDPEFPKLLGYDPAKDDDKDPNFWFQMHIIAVGNHFVAKLNGKVVTDFVHVTTPPDRLNKEKGKYEEGHIAFQMHHPGTVIQIKDLEVRELAPDFAWQEP